MWILRKIFRKFYLRPKNRIHEFLFHNKVGRLATKVDMIKTHVKTRNLVLNLFNNNSDFMRMDTIVRFLAVDEYFGNNKIGYDLYNKMQNIRIGKKNDSLHVEKFTQLLDNIELAGYSEDSTITINNKGFLKDGSHRLAYAAYKGIESLPVEIVDDSYMLDFSINWFKKNNFSIDEINNIQEGLIFFKRKLNIHFSVLLWGPVSKYFDEIQNHISKKFSIHNSFQIEFDSQLSYINSIKYLYSIDSIADWKINKKIDYLKRYPYNIRYIQLNVSNPNFRLRNLNRKISTTVEDLKNEIRNNYKDLIEDYFYDIIIHTSDNYDNSEFLHNVLVHKIDLVNYFKIISEVKYFMVKKYAFYHPKDFPFNFCVGKDIDLIVNNSEYDTLCQLTSTFFLQFKNKFTVRRVLDNKNRLKIRVETNSKLIIQIDISTNITNVPDSFVQTCFDNIYKENLVNLIPETYEYFLLKLNSKNNNLKNHHLEFIEMVESNFSNQIKEISKSNIDIS